MPLTLSPCRVHPFICFSLECTGTPYERRLALSSVRFSGGRMEVIRPMTGEWLKFSTVSFQQIVEQEVCQNAFRFWPRVGYELLSRGRKEHLVFNGTNWRQESSPGTGPDARPKYLSNIRRILPAMAELGEQFVGVSRTPSAAATRLLPKRS